MESLGSHYKHKIKTAEEIAALIGEPPRKRKVIMCHGVFDVVHPGHLRHLLYAKSKADILVASLTADRHIAKGRYRPHVPQDLRAHQSRGLRDRRLRHHRSRADAAEEPGADQAGYLRQGL